MSDRILVIKHGALGDMALASGLFQSIREAHPQAHIVLLTTPPFKDLAAALGIFNEVWTDKRPKVQELVAVLKLRKMLNEGRFDRVYDLQLSDRTAFYYRFLFAHPKPEWVGHIKGTPFYAPKNMRQHALKRLEAVLATANIEGALPDLSRIQADIRHLDLPEKFALMIPGGSAHRPAKRWPAEHFAEVARWLLNKNITPLLIGTKADQAPLDYLKSSVAGVVDLAGKTNLVELAALSRQAKLAVGNDTGPIHVAAAQGVPCVVLFSRESNPAQSAPVGDHVTSLQKHDLRELKPAAVLAKLEEYL